jgi:hypothetical protein
MMLQAPSGWTPVKPPAGWAMASAPEPTDQVNVGEDASFSVNGQPLPSTLGESFSAFGQGLKETVDPRPLIRALYEQGPIEVLKSMGAAQQAEYEKGRQAFREGRFSEAMGHTAAWLMPLIGPAAATAGETIGTGQVARGTGQMAGLLMPFGAKQIAGRTGEAMNSVGERIAAGGERRLARKITPMVGREKLRFAKMAKDVAPTLAREPGMGAWSLDGLASKLADEYQNAIRGMDESYAPIPKTKQYPTGPIAGRLRDMIRALQVRGTGGSINPANYAEQLATLQTALKEVQGLGNLTSIDNLRNLITAWQKGGEEAYTPSVVADYLRARGRGRAWADAGGAAREYLVSREPTTAPSNARYSLIQKARDTVEAARETEFTRPARGRGYASKIIGGTIGLGAAGGEGALAGVVIAMLLEKAEASATAQIHLARLLTKAGDAFRSGKPAVGMKLLQQEAERAGIVIPGVARAQGGPVAVQVGENQAMPGAPTIGPRDNSRR